MILYSNWQTLIYQPSNMPHPIQRENVDSVGDNFIMRPAPPQDNERRSSFYDTIDSENPVCITSSDIAWVFRYSLKFIFLLIFYCFFFTNIEFDDYWLLKSSLRNTLQWDLTKNLFLIRKKLINKIIWKNIMESKIKENFMILNYVNNMKQP